MYDKHFYIEHNFIVIPTTTIIIKIINATIEKYTLTTTITTKQKQKFFLFVVMFL